MNALFIQRISDYQHSPFALVSAEVIITTKITRSNVLLNHFQQKLLTNELRLPLKTTEQLLLHEARTARVYWRRFGTLVPAWVNFETRAPHTSDITNKLLDIGYHHVGNIVNKVLIEKECTTALGLFHRASTSTATPLVYDLLELFRADLVDMTVLTWLRQKKRPIHTLTQKNIADFVHDINERLDRRYYLADFKQCHTYRYYLELQIIKFIKAVNHQGIFEPIVLPTRHDTRCTCQPPHPML